MTKEEYGDFVLRYKGCGACFPMYHTLSRFEKMWFSAIQKDVAEFEKENVELKCECRRCVYSDCPCILSDYGKDRNGICDHFKDVFDENIELKEQNRSLLGSCEGATMMYEDLCKAKELLNEFLDFESSCMERGIYISDKIRAEAEQFLSEVEK